MDLAASAQRISKLETAIRTHRDQRGDDRCWLDDAALYAVLDDGVDPYSVDATLPPRKEFLESCSRYWGQRQSPGFDVEAGPGCMTIRQLQDRIVELEKELGLQASSSFEPLPGRLAEIMDGVILDAMKRYGNNRTKVAQALGITQKTVYNRLKRIEENVKAGGMRK